MTLHPVWREPPSYGRKPEPVWLGWLGRACALLAALMALAVILR